MALWLAIFQFYIPNKKIYYVFQFAVALLLFIDSLPEIKRNSKYFLLFLYPLTIMISCIVNRDSITYTQVARGFTSALLMIDIFLLVGRYERRRWGEKLINTLYKMSKIYAIANVLWIIGLIAMGKLQDAVQNDFLFSRGKFPTAYVLLFYLMFFCMCWNGNRLVSVRFKKQVFMLAAVGCIGICSLIETATGILAILAFTVLVLFGGNIEKLIKNPIAILCLIISSMFFVFLLGEILQIELVQNFIVNILHEDLSLTGRMELYSLLFPLVMKSGLWGGGFGSYVAATLAYHGWYNAQNGLAEIILTYGFVGGITFLLLVFFSFVFAKNHGRLLYLTILVFVIVAIVEIPFNSSFILLLSLSQIDYNGRLEFIGGRQ